MIILFIHLFKQANKKGQEQDKDCIEAGDLLTQLSPAVRFVPFSFP